LYNQGEAGCRSAADEEASRLLRYAALAGKRVPLKGVLLLLLSVDAAFIVLNALLRGEVFGLTFVYAQNFEPTNFDITKDRGYPEMFLYAQEALIVLLMAMVTIRNRSVLYLCWSLLFLYLLIDDSLMIHETLGVVVAEELGFSSWLGLRPEDFGELAVWASFGSAPVLVIAMLQIICSGHRAAKWSRYLLIMLAALVLTGGVFDMLHLMFADHPLLKRLFIVVEDGGEMAVWSATVWIVLLLTREDLDRRMQSLRLER
jgi:hypothetical protein